MNAIVSPLAPGRIGRRGWRMPVAAALVPVVAAASARLLPTPLVNYPVSAVVPAATWIGEGLTWLARTATIGPVHVSDITRQFAALCEAPIRLLILILSTGWRTGYGDQVRTVVPALPWCAVLGAATLSAHMVGGTRLTVLTVLGLAYIVVFGMYPDAVMTVVSVAASTVVAMASGLAIGAWAVRRPKATHAVEVMMNVMQTVPVFAYLVPTLLFLGYGPSAALAATVVYALPPMVHATILGLRSVPTELIELGAMTGASRRQMFWKIRVPAAMPLLGIGLNQSVMACLNMVTIASMIGSGGLGLVVLTALRRLDIGHALEAGMAIVVLAVILDGFGQAASHRLASGRRLSSVGFPHGRLVLGWLVVATVLALWVPALQAWPAAVTLSTASFWNALVTWMNLHWFDALDAVRSFMLIHVMLPTKLFLLALPWSVVVAFVAAAGFLLDGPAAALTAAALAGFVAVTGYWEPAVVSVYLVTIGVLGSLVLGVPIGYALSGRPAWREPANLVLDTLQTLPTLVYILPAVMLFRNGDFSAVLAIMSYAVAPAVRYTMHAFANVPETRLELARMCGATSLQSMRMVRFPAALPTLLLGLNQTVMMAIAMLVITALVGTRDLGQQVFIALSRLKVGEGIVGGLAVAAIALVADLLIRKAAVDAGRRNGVTV